MFSDAVLAKLKALARSTKDDGCISTDVAKDALGVNEPKWQRLAADKKYFPNRRRIGRLWYINAAKLYEYALLYNRLHAGLPLSKCAPICRSTVATLRRLFDAGEFIEAIGFVAGFPRFDEAAVRKWARARLTALGKAAA